MLAVRTLPAVTVMLLFMSISTQLHAQMQEDSMLSSEGDLFTLRVDQEDGTPLIELLALFGRLLDVPIAYESDSVAAIRVRIVGDVTFQRDAIRPFFDELIRAHGFVSWDPKGGGDRLVTIVAVNSGNRRQMGGFRRWGHQVVPLEKLDEQPPRVSALYTTVIPLRHVDSRALMSTFNPFVDTDGEMIRSVEQSNSILITSLSMDTLREIRDLIALVDVESSAEMKPSELEDTVATLEQKVEDLEQKLEELEQHVK